MSYVESIAAPETLAHSERSEARLSENARTGLRLAFGVVLAINAVLKWLPGYRHTYLAQLKA